MDFLPQCVRCWMIVDWMTTIRWVLALLAATSWLLTSTACNFASSGQMSFTILVQTMLLTSVTCCQGCHEGKSWLSWVHQKCCNWFSNSSLHLCKYHPLAEIFAVGPEQEETAWLNMSPCMQWRRRTKRRTITALLLQVRHLLLILISLQKRKSQHSNWSVPLPHSDWSCQPVSHRRNMIFSPEANDNKDANDDFFKDPEAPAHFLGPHSQSG